MEIVIQGKHISVGNSLREHIETTLQSRVKRYFEHAINASVTLSKSHNLFHTNIIVNEGTGRGIIIKSSNEDPDPYHSVDSAISKIEKQLRKYKERLKDHHKVHSVREPHVLEELVAMKYVISAHQDAEDNSIQPVVIAEKRAPLAKMTVDDAMMRLNLMDLPALLFINKENSMISAVYHRKDGNISWIETEARH